MKRSWGTKLYYGIGEVSELTELQPYTLRAWEKEFSCLRPRRVRGKNRAYRERDIGIILLIKRLLHEERYSTRGVRQKLKGEPGLINAAAEEATALVRGEEPPSSSRLASVEAAISPTTTDQPAGGSAGGASGSGVSEEMKACIQEVRRDLKELLALLA